MERALALCLKSVVELLGDPGLELLEQRLDVEAGGEDREDPREPAELAQVPEQGLAGPGILDLDGDLAAVGPDRLVDLTDAGRRRRLVVESRELLPPVGAELVGEHGVHRRGRQGRGGLLQLGQRRTVRRGHLLGQGCLEDAQGLAELHRATLELAQDLEQLLGRARLQLCRDQLGRAAPEALAQTDRPAPCHAERQGGELGAAGDRALGDVVHPLSLPVRRVGRLPGPVRSCPELRPRR